jgi:hypothetical protein
MRRLASIRSHNTHRRALCLPTTPSSIRPTLDILQVDR